MQKIMRVQCIVGPKNSGLKRDLHRGDGTEFITEQLVRNQASVFS